MISYDTGTAISLKLDAPTAVAQAHLVFDTGMHRKLSYSVVFKTNNPVSTWGPQVTHNTYTTCTLILTLTHGTTKTWYILSLNFRYTQLS